MNQRFWVRTGQALAVTAVLADLGVAAWVVLQGCPEYAFPPLFGSFACLFGVVASASACNRVIAKSRSGG